MDKTNKQEEDCNYLVLGLDDAGRGCLIGNMVLAGCLFNKQAEQELKGLGIADSKLVTRKKREKLIEIIKEKTIAYNIQMATPAEIDTGMGIGLNLNQVEALEAGLIINEIVKKISGEDKKNLRIVIDCPSVNLEGWKKQLMDYVKDHSLNIICEHKADRNHVIVAAASILAKVTRDRELEKIKEQIGFDCGSGYPSDPKVKKFLKQHVNDFKEHHIFRESWATFQNAKHGLNQSKLPDY